MTKKIYMLTKEEKVAFDKLSNCMIPTADEFRLLVNAAMEDRVDTEKLHRNTAKSSAELRSRKRSHHDPTKKKPHRRGTISY